MHGARRLHRELQDCFPEHSPLLTPRGNTALYLAFSLIRRRRGGGSVLLPSTVCPSVALAAVSRLRRAAAKTQLAATWTYQRATLSPGRSGTSRSGQEPRTRATRASSTFAQAMRMLHFEWTGFYDRPIAAFLILAALLTVAGSIYSAFFKKERQ